MGAVESREKSTRSYIRATVSINVYDVDTSTEIYFLNGMLRPLGTGIFHCGVQILSDEWSFRGGRHGGTGVFRCPPGLCGNLRPRETLTLGTVVLPTGQVEAILERLKLQWPCREYDIFRRNCSHFCDEFCTQLGVGPLPAWVTNMAGAAAQLADVSWKVRSATSTLAETISSLFEADTESDSTSLPVPVYVERMERPRSSFQPQPGRGGVSGMDGMRQVDPNSLNRPPPPASARRQRPLHPTLLTSRSEPVITREAVTTTDMCWPLPLHAEAEDEDSLVVGCSF
mmetsp:Transcript_69631/g.166153  ORF Transcript_69631/g.166153 Transcript_69631/m.166153 type:complete len:285 (+) Transcript_69631:81-935(+)